jgi:hypothetical protein
MIDLDGGRHPIEITVHHAKRLQAQAPGRAERGAPRADPPAHDAEHGGSFGELP